MYDPEVEELLGPVGSPGSAASSPSVAPPAAGGESAIVGGAYEGASRFDRAVALWQPPLQSADQDILVEKRDLDARSRDSLRNDAYVAGGASLHKDSIVGAMFLLNAKPNGKVLGLDETWEQEFQEEVEAKFTLAAESPNNWFDAARLNTLTELVRLAVGVNLACGESLASVEWLNKDTSRPFKTALQMVDVDRLSTPWDQIEGPLLRGGVARDQYGAPQGYWIRKAHPADVTTPDVYSWKFVPARKPWGRPQIIHIYEQLRPDQSRGVSQMVAALKELRITKKFRDVVLQNAVANATFAASIESELPAETVFAQLGANGDYEKGIVDYGTAFLGAIAQYTGASRNMMIDGVRIPHLFPGTKLQLRPAGQGGPLGTDFETSLLRYIAAALDVSYEELSRDYTQTNYSSARAAQNNTWKGMVSRKKRTADRFGSTAYRLWFEEMANAGQIEALRTPKAPSIYDGLNMDAYTACDWIGASRGQIDELKETQAAALRLKLNLSTQEEEAARLGKDWRRINAQRQREIADQKARDIYVDPNAADPNAKAAHADQGEKADA